MIERTRTRQTAPTSEDTAQSVRPAPCPSRLSSRLPNGGAVTLLVAAFLAATLLPTAAAQDPLELVPQESLLCWRGRPFAEADAGPASRPSAIATLLDVGSRIAGSPLRPREQIGIRLLEAFALAVHYPFALVLVDAQAKPTESGLGKRVDKLRIALIIRTDGKSEPFRKVIQKTVNELTDGGRATLARKTAANRPYEELREARLDECVAWGDIGDCFVITYGPDVWPLIASVAEGRTPNLAAEEWIRQAQGALKAAPLIEIIVAAGKARERLDPFVDGRATQFFKVWHADKVDRGYWALGFEGRALYCVASFRTGDQIVRRVYADPNIRDPRFLSTIPDSARYAIYRLPIATMLPRLFAGYYATQDAHDRERAQAQWDKIQQQYGFDAQRDLLDNLGDTIVLHNDPQHPLRLPLAFTSLMEIRREPQRVRDLVEKTCQAWGDWLANSEDAEGPGWARLERADDGVWSFQYGPVAGLAWIVTDRFIVTSWSPNALRAYLEKAGKAAGARPGEP
ncbi:MAG: hypothetical protein HZB38_05255 [Planctomycetes bacterium]|nr:hypothetical protein [Planctomycetota bacterium]